MKRSTVLFLTWLSIAMFVVIPVALATLLSNGCTGTQRVPQTWDVNAQAAIVVAAHLVDGADSYIASHYAADAQKPDANLAELDARYEPLNTAIHLARPVLQSAQSEIAAVARLVADRSALESARVGATCLAMVGLRESRTAITHIGEALAVAGFADAPVLTSGLNTLTSAITAGPLCVAGSP